MAKVARDVAELRAEAQTAGVSFEEFQRLKYMAEQNLIGIDALTDGFKELNLRADEFIMTGQGSAAEAFERLGYTASELKQKLADPSALFSEIVDRLGKFNDAAQIRIADEIFGGTGGEQFVRLLQGGADGIARLKDEANRLGIVVSEAEGQALTDFDRTLRRITDQLGVIGQKIAIAVLPYLQEFADDLTDPSFVQDAEDIAEGVAAAFGVIADAIREVLSLMTAVGEAGRPSKGGCNGLLITSLPEKTSKRRKFPLVFPRWKSISLGSGREMVERVINYHPVTASMLPLRLPASMKVGLLNRANRVVLDFHQRALVAVAVRQSVRGRLCLI